MSPEKDRTRDAVDSEPKHYQRAIPAPERQSKLTKDMYIPLRPILNGDTLCCRLYRLDN